jgi:L-arabinose isomerase
MGHLYPGMLDVSTDLTRVSTTFGSHVEVLEFDDLRVRVDELTDAQVAHRRGLARQLFTLDASVDPDDFAWAAKVSLGLDHLVDDFGLDTVAYYRRALAGEQHERLSAAMILGSSIPTAAPRWPGSASCAPPSRCSRAAPSAPVGRSPRSRRRKPRRRRRDGPRRSRHPAISAQQPLLRGLGLHSKRGGGSRSSSTSPMDRSPRSGSVRTPHGS